jgi:hypothetical protein
VTIRRWEDVPRCLVPKLGSPGRLARIANVDTLGDDLVLLSLNPRSGRVSTVRKIGYGLMGSELVRLAAARARLDSVAVSTAPLDLSQAAFGGSFAASCAAAASCCCAPACGPLGCVTDPGALVNPVSAAPTQTPAACQTVPGRPNPAESALTAWNTAHHAIVP